MRAGSEDLAVRDQLDPVRPDVVGAAESGREDVSGRIGPHTPFGEPGDGGGHRHAAAGGGAVRVGEAEPQHLVIPVQCPPLIASRPGDDHRRGREQPGQLGDLPGRGDGVAGDVVQGANDRQVRRGDEAQRAAAVQRRDGRGDHVAGGQVEPDHAGRALADLPGPGEGEQVRSGRPGEGGVDAGGGRGGRRSGAGRGRWWCGARRPGGGTAVVRWRGRGGRCHRGREGSGRRRCRWCRRGRRGRAGSGRRGRGHRGVGARAAVGADVVLQGDDADQDREAGDDGDPPAGPRAIHGPTVSHPLAAGRHGHPPGTTTRACVSGSGSGGSTAPSATSIGMTFVGVRTSA